MYIYISHTYISYIYISYVYIYIYKFRRMSSSVNSLYYTLCSTFNFFFAIFYSDILQ